MFNGAPVTFTSTPAQFKINRDDQIEVTFFTDQLLYLGYTVLTVRAILPHIDTVPLLNRRLLDDKDLRQLQ